MGVIRFLLALSVALWHVPGHPLLLMYAAPAVLGFFIISGFYMAMVLTEKYRDDARSFYLARFWRLYPAYAAMAVIMILWFVATMSPTAFTTWLPVPFGDQIVLALLNVVVVGQDLFQFSRYLFGDGSFLNEQWMLVGQAWSLSSEAFFYCLAPFVVHSPRRTAGLLIAALATRWILLGWLGLSMQWGYLFFPGALCMFLMGALGYHAYARMRLRNAVTWAKIVAAGWLVWLAYSVASTGMMLPPGPQGSADGVTFWIAYVAFALSAPLIFAWSRHSRIDRAIGDLSYPLYLVHGLVQGILYFVVGLPQGRIEWALVAVSASVLAAVAMRLGVEMPIEAWRASHLRTSITVPTLEVRASLVGRTT